MGTPSGSAIWQAVCAIAALAAIPISIIALIASCSSGNAQVATAKKALQQVDEDHKREVIEKIAWDYHFAASGELEYMEIENHSLSPIYDVSLDLGDGVKNYQSFQPGDVLPCTRVKVNLQGVGNQVRTDIYASNLGLTDNRGHHWFLTSDRAINEVPEFSYGLPIPDEAGLLKRTYTLEQVACS